METLERLESLLSRLERPFVWSGTFKPRDGARLRLPNKKHVPLVPLTKGGKEDALAALVAQAEAAVFGQGKRTKRDPRVRDGLQITAKAGLSLEGVDLRKEGLLDEIGAALAPDDPTSLSAELYALNVYPRGGHFAAHKDTPRGADMIGTLVIGLPYAFDGGVLRLGREDREMALDWTESSRWTSGDLACAAFFGDVEHEIATVEGGTRVTLTFLLTRKTKTAKKKSSKAEANDESELARCFADLAQAPEVVTNGLSLQIPCFHEYAVTKDTPVTMRLEPDSEILAQLKGRDAVVARAALDAEIPTMLAHCLCVESDGVSVAAPLRQVPSEKYVARLRKLVARSFDEGEAASGKHITDEMESESEGQARVVGGFSPSATFLGAGAYSATDYYGNEASDAFYYVGAVLELTYEARSASVERALVVHPKFGRGDVVAAMVENGEKKLRIRFADGNERTLLERFVRYEA